MSGGNFATSLLQAGVIDEIGLNVHPVLLGAGVPAFLDPGARVKLELTECRQLDGGCVFVTYRVRIGGSVRPVAFHLQVGAREDGDVAPNPITGNSLRWNFQDGPMAGKSFDHAFARNGGVTFREVGSDPNAKPGSPDQYQVASLGQDIHTVAYLSPPATH